MTEKRVTKRNAGSLKGRRARRALLALFLSVVLIISDIPVSILVSVFGKDNSITNEIDGLRNVNAAPSKLIVYGQEINNSHVTTAINVDGKPVASYKNGVLNLLRDYSGAGFDVDTDGDATPDINTCIYAEGDLIIELGTSDSSLGVNATINNTTDGFKKLYGIYVKGNLTVVNATAKLTRAKRMTLKVKCSGTATEQSAGIYADSFTMPAASLMRADEVTVSANGASVENKETAYDGLRFSYGICAENSYVQNAGTVWASGGNISGAPKAYIRNSYGLFTRDLNMAGGKLYAAGGIVSGAENSTSESMHSIGLGIAFREKSALGPDMTIDTEGEEPGKMQISGGSITALGGMVIKNGSAAATSIACVSHAENSCFSSCNAEFNGGDSDSEYYTNSKGFLATGNVTVNPGAMISAVTGTHGNAQYHTAFTCRKTLDVFGGSIEAYSNGGVLQSVAMELRAVLVRKNSNAYIRAEAEPSVLGETEDNINNTNQSYAIKVGAVLENTDPFFIIEEESGAEIWASATREVGGTYYRSGALYIDCPADIASGKIYAILKASKYKSMVKGGALVQHAGDTKNVMNISGGEIELYAEGGNNGYNVDTVCVTSGLLLINNRENISYTPVSITDGSIHITATGANAAGISNAVASETSPLTYELHGEELTIESEWKAVDDHSNAGILDCSIVKDRDDALDGSVFSMSEFEDTTAFRAVSGTKAAPAIADIFRMHHYEAEGELLINESFADVMPEDAGEVRYVAGEAKAETKTGEVSAATVVNSFEVNSTSGAVNANVTLTPEAIDDVITLPVSIRSEGYKPVSANVIITITDKEVTEVNISGDSRKQYGDEDFTLTAETEHAGGHPSISWKSSNTSVATIDADGKVSIIGVGTTKIRADYISDEYFGIGTMTLTVDPRPVRLINRDVEDKIYDGTRDAVLKSFIYIDGVLEADRSKLSVMPGSQFFADKNAGTEKDVYFENYKLGPGSGGDARANYVLEQPASVKANISPKAVTATVTAVDRGYEKGRLMVALEAGTVSGVIAGDEVSVDVSEAVGTMADDAEGEDKAVIVSGVKLTGTDAGNYSLTSQPEGVTVNISAAHVHDWGEWIVIKEATATEKGLKRRVCRTDASHIEEEEIPVKSEPEPQDSVHVHVMIHHAAVAATEEAEGNIEYWECSECKKLYKDAEGKIEITLADTVIPKLPDPTTVTKEKVTEAVTETVNGMPVSISLNIVYPEAVSWTGSRIIKAQLEALSGEGSIVKVNFSGLEEALKGKIKEGTDVSKLVTVTYTPSKDKNAGTKGYFTLKAKLNTKAVKKAKIKGADKKALNTLVKKLNEQQKKVKYEYDIVPVKLAEAESITIKAKLKKDALQTDEQNKLKGLKSVKIKVQIKGIKKAKTFTYSAKKAKDLFVINITDAAAKMIELSALPGTGFKGSRSGITITK
ncbi:MAG: hypothetical protein K5686_10990 [Lachnospiraceae bacterium]|nr:hypothetical protein [Lachnospiraceae bacterium]